jgi:hypothetical protein
MADTPRPAVPLDVLQRAREWIEAEKHMQSVPASCGSLVRDLLALVEDGPHRQALVELHSEMHAESRDDRDKPHAHHECYRVLQALRDADAQVQRKE